MTNKLIIDANRCKRSHKFKNVDSKFLRKVFEDAPIKYIVIENQFVRVLNIYFIGMRIMMEEP